MSDLETLQKMVLQLIDDRARFMAARDDAEQLLGHIRAACRKLNHPLALSRLACPYCAQISELLGDR